MKRKLYAIIIFSILILSTFSVFPTQGLNIKNVKETDKKTEKINEFTQVQFLDSVKDASILGLGGILNDKEIVSHPKNKIIRQEIRFDPSDCILRNIDQRQNYLEINGLEPFGAPGIPMLPMKTITIDIPKNAEVLTIGMSNVYYKEIKNSLDIIPNPEPISWSNKDIKPEITKDLFLSNMRIYNSNQFYPGKVLSYQTGNDNEKTQVFVRIYPIQYIPKLGKTILITEREIELYYRNEEISEQSQILGFSSDINVIITPPSLFDHALELENFHDGEGTSTMVVNTTWIYDHYDEADDPPYEGYKNPSLPHWEMLGKYEYSLAKRIISYLNDINNHPDLKYVTLLGNARLVPPSYYCFPDATHSWVATDFFYASPDYDFVPNYFIGRLPVNNSNEAAHVVNKIKNWNATSKLFSNIAVAGAKPFGTPYYFGEMITVDAINRGFFNGTNIAKYFKTEGSFDKNNLTCPLMGDVGLLYHIGHGNGKAIIKEGDSIWVEDLMNLPASDTSPIFVSIACKNGAYDLNVIGADFNVSFGEAILLSNAGGIAYVGGSRINYGHSIFTLDIGYVTTIKEAYLAGMLTYFLEAYHNGGTTLGNLSANVMISFLEYNDFSDPLDIYTLFCYVLLGDPALKIPTRPADIEYQTPYSTVNNDLITCDINSIFHMDIESSFGEIPLCAAGEDISVSFTTNSPTVDIKTIDGLKSDNMVIERVSLSNDNNYVSYNFTLSNSTIYFIRAITEDGKEGWQYAAAATNIVDDDYEETTPGWGETRWASIQEAIDHSDENDMIYVFNGSYYENILINKAVRLFGESSSTTIIDGRGQGDVVNINYISKDYDVFISGFKIINSGKSDNNAGIFIAESERIGPYILGNIISHNLNGILFQNEKTRAKLEQNIISNNTYGIHVKGDCYAVRNSICNNDYGIYVTNTKYLLSAFNDIGFNIYGICLHKSEKNNFFQNDIISNEYGLCLDSSEENNFTRNDITDSNLYGIYLEKSNNNSFYCNNIIANKGGLHLDSSENNNIACNNFINNVRHAGFRKCRNNYWHNNYWDNWLGLKFKFYSSKPKLIFGKAGRFMGLIPWINLDRMPAKIPNN